LFLRKYGNLSFEEIDSLSSLELEEAQKKINEWTKNENDVENERTKAIVETIAKAFSSFRGIM